LAPSIAQVDADGCLDDRFPRLAGHWLLYCEAGRLDRALHLPTRTRMTLQDAARSPGASGATDGSATLFDPAIGTWRLPSLPVGEASISPEAVLGLTGPFAGPPGVGTVHAAVVWADRVEVALLGAQRAVRMRTPARAVAGEEVALVETPGSPQGEALAAWVEDAGADGFDIVGTTGRGDRVPLSTGPGDARLLASDGRSVAWVEQDAVVVVDAASRDRVRHEANTGFLHAPTLDADVACWEERPPAGCPGDVDIRCSDGTTVGGPGDQLAPSLARGVLVFREGRTLRALTLDQNAAPSTAPPPAGTVP
jgi:hypothetical protein